MRRRYDMVRRPLAAFAPWTVLLALLAGCAGGPRYPLYTALDVAESFGYTEQQTSKDSYRVTYRAPVETSYRYGAAARERIGDQLLDVAYDLALRRAAELTLAKGYPAFTTVQRFNDVTADVEPRYDYPFYWRPYGFYAPYSLRYGYYPFSSFYPGFYRPVTQVAAEVTLEVQLQETPGPRSFDARETLDRLRTEYGPANGSDSAQP